MSSQEIDHDFFVNLTHHLLLEYANNWTRTCNTNQTHAVFTVTNGNSSVMVFVHPGHYYTCITTGEICVSQTWCALDDDYGLKEIRDFIKCVTNWRQSFT
jgi:hypothetical protein